MNWDWLHTPIPERWTRFLRGFAVVLGAVVIVVLVTELVCQVWSKRRLLPLGFLAGISYATIYATIAFFSILASIKIRERFKYLNGRQGKRGPTSSTSDHPRPLDPRQSTPWFVWIALFAIIIMIAHIIDPRFLQRVGFIPVTNDDRNSFNSKNNSYLLTYLIGICAIFWVVLIEFLHHRHEGAGPPSNQNHWRTKDIRTLSTIVLVMVIAAAEVICLTEIVETDPDLTRPSNNTPKTVATAIIFVQFLVAVKWLTRLLRNVVRRLRHAFSGQRLIKPKPSAGLWDRDLDHEFASESRPVS